MHSSVLETDAIVLIFKQCYKSLQKNYYCISEVLKGSTEEV